MVIYTSLGFTREIGTVLQAIDVLLNWPSRRHVADYYAALDACGSALRGEASVAGAREAFRLFAEHTGILALEHFRTGAALAEGRPGDRA
ncbi:hypothetical protein ASG62_18965 [Aureimonas sp. Leaf427]|nr:hypothetical protein ASG62_18965 [Aureimonas sp. Leaf427]